MNYKEKVSLHVILLLLLLFPCVLSAQITELSIQHITDQQGAALGFSGDVVYDSLGIIWISGWDKITRYDGKSVTRFYSNSTSSHLDIEGRSEIVLSEDELFWIMDDEKIQLFNPYTFQVDSTIYTLEVFSSYGVRNAALLAGNHCDFWLLSSEFSQEGERYSILAHGKNGKVNIVDIVSVGIGLSTTMQTISDTLYLISTKETRRYSSEAKLLDIQNMDTNDLFHPRSFVSNDGSIWVKGNAIYNKSSRDIFRYSSETNSFVKIQIPDRVNLQQTKEIAVLDNEIWFAGQNEMLFKYNYVTDSVFSYSKLISQISNYAYIGSEPQQIIVDHNGIIWISTSRGLLKIIEKSVPITTYLTEIEDNCTYNFCSMRGIAEDDDGNIYFSYYSGIHKLDVVEDRLEVFQKSERNKHKGAFSLEYLDGKLYWLGMIVDLDTQDMVDLFPDLFRTHVTSCTDGKRHFWFYTWGPQALYHLDTYTEKLTKLECPKEFQSIEFEMNDMVWDASTAHIICATSNSGLVIVDTLGHKIGQYTRGDTDTLESLPSANIKAVHVDREHNYWIGHSAGFSNIDLRQKSIKNYSVNPDDNLAIVGILEDDADNLWMSSDKGIYRFEKSTNEVVGFPENTTISTIEFNRSSSFVDRNKRMYFGSISGVYSFDPKVLANYLKSEESSDIIITQFARYNSREGKLYEVEAGVSQLEEIQLSYHDTYFTLDFISPNYLATYDAQYSYILEGFENVWRKPSSSTTLKYDRLPPGKYLLRIRLTNAGNDFPQAEKAINIVIKNIWYKTILFYVICSCLFFALIYLIFRIRLEQKLKLQRIREKISLDLHDEVGTTLTGLAMQSEIMSYTMQGEQKGKLESIIEMSRNAMLQMRDVVWALDSSKDNVGDLLSKISEFAYEVLTPKDIEFVMSSNLPKDKALAVHIKKELYLICKEAIANAAKHSNGNKLKVELHKEDRLITLLIHDNGQEIDIKQQQQGSGLKNMERRAIYLNGKISIDCTDGFLVKLEMFI